MAANFELTSEYRRRLLRAYKCIEDSLNNKHLGAEIPALFSLLSFLWCCPESRRYKKVRR